MFLLVAAVAGAILLGAMWFFGDVQFSTKVTLTVLYAASWALLLVDAWLAIIVGGIIDSLIWFVTFGPTRR